MTRLWFRSRYGKVGGRLTGSVERRGGYSPSGAPVAKLPKVPAGPAPGSRGATPVVDTSRLRAVLAKHNGQTP